MSDLPKPAKPTRAQLRKKLRFLAQRFADDVLQLVDNSGYWDEPETQAEEPPLARRIRRSDAALEEVAKHIEQALRSRDGAAAISEIAEALGYAPRELTHPVNRLLDEARIERVGEKRGARYRIVSQPRSRRSKRRRGR